MADDAEASEENAGDASGPTKKRWFDRGVVWLAVVVVLAVVALGASFFAEDSGPSAADAAPPVDITAYCSAARSLGEAPSPSATAGDPSTFIAYRDYLGALRVAASPSSMAERIQRVEDSFQPVIDTLSVSEAEENDIPKITDALDAQSTAVAADASEISDYTYRICGFRPEDLASAEDTLESADQAPEPSDPIAFCAAAREFAEAPAPEASTSGATESYEAYRDRVQALAPTAPPSVATRIQNIVDSFQPVLEAIGSGGTRTALDSVADAMDQQESRTATDSAQLRAYIERVCGFDMAQVHEQAQPSSTTTAEDGAEGSSSTSSADGSG